MPGFAGVVVVVAGVVGFGLPVVPVFEAVLVPGAGVPDAPLPEVGVAAGAETGSEVNGVGSGGNGFESRAVGCNVCVAAADIGVGRGEGRHALLAPCKLIGRQVLRASGHLRSPLLRRFINSQAIVIIK